MAASVVIVTRQLPATPHGCHKIFVIDDWDRTCIERPMVEVLSFMGVLGSWPRWLESGRMARCTVWEVAMASNLPLGDMEI